MQASDEQIKRVMRYESMLDEISSAVGRLNDALDAFDRLRPSIDALSAYYSGGEWKRDSADDEAGRFPPSLKRGVLSEDAVYDLLEEIDTLQTRISKQQA